MKTSKAGDRDTARNTQATSNIPDKLRGPWFQVSKDNIEKLTDQIDAENYDDEYSWFSRSPSGGGHGGGCVLLVYVTEEPDDYSVRDCDKGDSIGRENGKFLKNWWLRVHKSEVEKLTVVGRIMEEGVAAHFSCFVQDPEYVAIRQTSIALTFPQPMKDEL